MGFNLEQSGGGGGGTTLTGTGLARQTGVCTELSGDATTSGSNAVTVVKVNGLAVPISAKVLGSNASGQLVDDSALPNGVTATTQTQADNSTKVATTAYVDTGLATKQASLTGTGLARNTGACTELSGDVTTSGSNAATVGKVTGTLTSYNGINTVSNGVPSILATVNLTAQAAAISATTLYTPAASGFFRISMMIKVTTPASGGTPSSTLGGITIAFKDGTDSVAQSVLVALTNNIGAIALSATGNLTTTLLSGHMVVWAASGQAITYAIGYASAGTTAMQYEAHFRVEAL